MRILRNAGNDRVIDQLRDWLVSSAAMVDLMSPDFSLHAFAEAREMLGKAGSSRLLLGTDAMRGQSLFGGPSDISYRNKLQGRWLAKSAHGWIKGSAEVRHAVVSPPLSMIAIKGKTDSHAVLGTCAFTTEGLGVTPGSQLGLVQASDTAEEAAAFAAWFQTSWDSLKQHTETEQLLTRLAETASQRPPSLLYFKFLFELFKDLGDELDEERIVKSATGIRNTTV